MQIFRLRPIIRILVLISIAILLTSCLGIRIETKFNTDGSGTAISVIRVSKLVLEMGSEEETGIDIPTSIDDIREQFAKNAQPGVRLVDVSQEETEEDIILTSVIEFESLEALTAADDSPVEAGTLSQTSEGTLFSMRFGEALKSMRDDEGSPFAEEGLDDAMIAMLQAFLEGYEVEYRITAPRKIKRYTDGELSADGMTLSYKLPMSDYFVLEEPYDFEVVW